MSSNHVNERRFNAVRWMEITRRLMLFLGLTIGVWLIWNPVGEIYRIHIVHFSEEFSRLPGWQRSNHESIEAFIQYRLEGRTIETRDAFWIDLYRDLDRTVTRREPAPYLNRTVVSGYNSYTFFHPQDIQAAEELQPHDSFIYLAIHDHAGQTLYMGVNRWIGQDVISYSPSPPDWLLFPLRTVGLIIFICGFLAYILIPRHRPKEGVLYYRTGPTIVGPDICGIILYGGFFLIGRMLLVWEGPHLIFISIILWALSLFGVVILLIGLWYSSIWYRIDNDGIVQCSLKGMRKVFWHEIKEVSSYQKRVPAWLAGLFLLFGSYGNLSTQMAIQQGFRVENGIRIDVEGKKPLIIMADAFTGMKALEKAFHTHHVITSRNQSK